MMRIIAKSSDFNKIYTDNAPSDFRIQILRQVPFDVNAQVSLTHLIVPPVEADKICYILCSLCNYCQIGAVFRRVLRVVHLAASKFPQQVFLDSKDSIELNHNNNQEIRFSFKDENDQYIKFVEGHDTFVGILVK